MAQNDDVQVPENESGSVLPDNPADLVPAPASPADDAPEDGASQPAPSGPRRPRQPASQSWDWLTTGVWAALAWLGLALAAWVAKGQISSVVAEVTSTGQYPVSALTGIGQLGAIGTAPHAPLMAWVEAGLNFPALRTWLWTYIGMNLLFIAGFTLLGITILKNRPQVRRTRWLLTAVAAGYALEAAMGAIALVIARPDGAGNGGQDAMAWPLHVATDLKWLAVVALTGWLAYRVHASYRDYRASSLPIHARTGIYADLRRLYQALEVQRFSLVVVLLLGLIAIGPPLSGTLEQMPDVQRAWLSSGSHAGLSQMFLAALAQLLLALMLGSLGRMRTVRALAKFAGHGDDRRADPQLLAWIAVALSVPALAGILVGTSAATVSWTRVAAWSGILLIFALVSWGIDLRDKHRAGFIAPFPSRQLPDQDRNVVRITRLAGDALAVMVVAVTPLGAVRSFMAPALVIGGTVPVVALAIGMAGALTVPLLCGWLRPISNPQVRGPATDTPEPRTARAQRRDSVRHLAGTVRVRFLWVIGAVFLVTDLWLIIAPLNATHVLGVLATAVIAIGSLATLLGTLAFLVQTRKPLSVFRFLRLNVTPVLTIIVIIAVVGGVLDKNSSLHQVSGPVTAGGAPRPSLSAALTTWLHNPLTTACAVPAPGAATAGGHQVRIEPLVQVAASGGGIRAAWWTVHVLGTLAGTRCGNHDVFAVSSVSGGSVGAAVLAAVPRGTARPVATANASIATIADPDALAAGIDGFMLRDTIAGYTGLDIRAQMPGTARYPDRAALMQAVWQDEDARLAAPFPLRHSWLPWTLLLNSTSVATGCRAVLSSVALPHPPASMVQDDGLSCGVGASGPSGSYDFFARLGCMRNISTATAAMLSARFAYITPSGTLNGCGQASGTFSDQLVDGGYGDASGLSTLINLAPTLTARVREFNSRAIASAAPGQPVTLVVPVTVYLGNSVQPARAIVVPARTPEIRVPTSALSIGAATELTGTEALLQDAGAATAAPAWLTCGSADAVCADARAIASTAVPDPLIMVVPTEFPGVAAPLGWLLSKDSQTALDEALRRDIAKVPACGAYQPDYLTQRPYCLPGMGDLADLRLLTGQGH
jgi:hypothetical protein